MVTPAPSSPYSNWSRDGYLAQSRPVKTLPSRRVVAKAEGWIGSLGLADVNHYTYTMDKQQGPAVEHRELHSIPCVNQLYFNEITKQKETLPKMFAGRVPVSFEDRKC